MRAVKIVLGGMQGIIGIFFGNFPVYSSDRGKKIVDGEMFSLEERGEGWTQEGGAQV